LRVAGLPEEFALWRVYQAAKHLAAATAGRVVLGLFGYAESLERVEFTELIFEHQCTFRDYPQSSPASVCWLKALRDDVLGRDITLFGDDGGINCFRFGFAFDYLPADFRETFDYLHRLEARHDAGLAELFGDWLKRAITYNNTDVAGAEKGVYPVVFVAKQRLHRGHNEFVIAKDAEVVDIFICGLLNGDGSSGRGCFKADGDEDHCFGGVVPGQLECVFAAEDNPDVAGGFSGFEGTAFAGDANHIAVRRYKAVIPVRKLKNRVDISLVSYANGAAGSR
jgi:hypothetical protein